MADLTRREVVQGAIAAGVGLLAPAFEGRTHAASTTAPTTKWTGDTAVSKWIDTRPNGEGMAVGTTWGLPWARGQVKKGDSLRVETDKGEAVAAQTWDTAYWPDGSVKWSAIAVGPAGAGAASFSIKPGTPAVGGSAVTVQQKTGSVQIDTGVIHCSIGIGGSLIDSIYRSDKLTASKVRLVVTRQNAAGDLLPTTRSAYEGTVDSVKIEQQGPVRAVIKLTGTHPAFGWGVSKERPSLLPFVVRLYFYAGSDVIRIMHSLVFDTDETKDFICGLGVQFDVPMTDAPHNRHVRFVGENDGMFGEAVRGITGLRRDPGPAARKAQVDGKATMPAEWATTVANRLDFIPAWGDFTLSQLCADGFQIKKRTKAGCGWIAAGAGRRAAGVGYIGGAAGGVSFGLRDFWQKHPAQLDVRNAATDVAQVTMWLYSPEAQPMDLRMYHDVMGMETYDKQNEGLNITYEDYEPGYGSPYGIARTSEMFLKIEPTTPTRHALVGFANVVRKPPMLMASPERFLETGVFGGQWTLPDRSTPSKAWIEDRLQITLDQYIREVDQRSWYGFWDYGDVMHSYDNDRHQWKYDIGGYAWDNSELSTDLWLWMSVLRSGRADVFRFAEAMCRHTGEVDVYHLGRFKGLGTRHGVQHWADSSKQSRISTPIYRRHYYYLTADERVGDLLTEQMGTVNTEKKIVVGRKLKPGSPTLPLPPVEDPPPGGELGFGGLNWGCAMAAWIAQAERTNDPAWHAKIVESLRGIGELSKGFYTSGTTINLDTGAITEHGSKEINLSHLMACFGLPEIAVELISLYGDRAPKFADAWAQYGRLYSGTDAQRHQELGDFKPGLFKEASLRDTHSRCTAYAALHGKDNAPGQTRLGRVTGRPLHPRRAAAEADADQGAGHARAASGNADGHQRLGPVGPGGDPVPGLRRRYIALMRDMTKHPPIVKTFPHLLHGGDYNPEQWLATPEVWDEDMRLLKLAHCNAVSVGIFSWAMLEPDDGTYDFGWLDSVIDKLTKNDTRFVLATPGGAKPVWMAKQYPDMLRTNSRREKQLWGGRHNHCFSSPSWRKKTAAINTLLADRYGQHPNLVLWHVNNEYNGDCHCDLCQNAFRDWLKQRYDNDLDKLNQAYWSTFWSHTYTDWSQIESPSPIGERDVHALNLDWKRFTTHQTIDCFKAESAPLRAKTKTPITTNLMAYHGLNYYALAAACDVVSWDSYPSYHDRDEDKMVGARFSLYHDLFRSMKRRPFILMESAPAQQNYKPVCKLKRPGIHQLEALQAVAHGSDSVMYFQWRKSRGSVEKFHGAVVDHHGGERTRVFKDVAFVGDLLGKLDAVVGTSTPADVAIIYDYENDWAIADARGPRNPDKEYFETCVRHYRAFWEQGVGVDVVDSVVDFSPYKLVVAPMLYMVRPGVAERIEKFVQDGGTFVTTYFSGIVNETDLCFLDGFPGPLRKLLGIWAEEIDTLYDDESATIEPAANNGVGLNGSYTARQFCDLIHAETAEVLATYGTQFYAGRPALTVNRVGGGAAYYVASRNDGRFQNDFFAGLVTKLGISRALGTALPDGVTAQVRTDGDRDFVFIFSFARKAHAISLGESDFTDAFDGSRVGGTLDLPAYGSRVLVRSSTAASPL